MTDALVFVFVMDSGGAEDVGMLIKLFKQFFRDYAKVDKSVILDD